MRFNGLGEAHFSLQTFGQLEAAMADADEGLLARLGEGVAGARAQRNERVEANVAGLRLVVQGRYGCKRSLNTLHVHVTIVQPAHMLIAPYPSIACHGGGMRLKRVLGRHRRHVLQYLQNVRSTKTGSKDG